MASILGLDAGYHGSWKVKKVDVFVKEAANTSGLEGVEFHLSDTGDIFWKVPKDAASVPYFVSNFDLYEVSGAKFNVLKFIGGQTGERFDFKATLKWRDALQLKYENVFTLFCEKVWIVGKAIEEPFSLHTAFNESFFSDLTIRADNGKSFDVHKVILRASCPQLAWDSIPPPLSCHPEDVLRAVLFFFYTECLPDDFHEETARKCLKVVGKLPGFGRFANKCQLYLKNVAVKNQIVSHMNDMHACGDRMVQHFRGQSADGPTKDENLLAEPAKLVYAIKQAIREAAVAGSKFLLICDLFARRKGELSKKERHDIMRYVKSRLPVFVKQLMKFFEAFREQLSRDISASQRHDVATYLVPQMDICLELATVLVDEGKHAVEEILKVTSAGDKKKHSTGDFLHRTVKNAMHMKELLQLKTAQEKAAELFNSMLWRQEAFECLSDDDKVYSVTKNMEQLNEEFPQILQKIEKLDMKVNEGFSMKNWKFVFKLGTLRVSWALQKVVEHRDTFRPIVTRINKLIHRDAFQSSLIQLGVLDVVPGDDNQDEPSASSDGSSRAPHPSQKQPMTVENLCTPPSPYESKLAQAMGELLASEVDTDMCFEIVTVTEEPSDIVVDHTQGHPVESQSCERIETRHQVKAHCVVIAARCDWFRRALLSGMRESIDKKIEVHDTDPALFKQFLLFLYTGQLDPTSMSTEQVADMMSLSDRYEVDVVKNSCETTLISRLDEDNVLFLLSLADQFHAKTLREAALKFVMEHSAVISSEIYEELPETLQSEVSSLVEWNRAGAEKESMSRYKGMQYDSDDSSEEEVDMSSLAKGLVDVGQLEMKDMEPNHSDSNSSDDEAAVVEPVVDDREQMMTCMSQLKEIIGDGISPDELERLSRAADFDVNRALNFFFNS